MTAAVANKVLVASANSDTAMHLLGWFAKHGFYVALEGDVSRLGDTSKPYSAPECLLLDDAAGASLLPKLVAAMRTRPDWARTVIVAIGAFSEEQEIELFRAGADDIVGKPLRSTALLYRILRRLRGQNV